MANPHHDTLSSILRPSFFTALHDLYFAWSNTDRPLDAATLLHFFSDDDNDGPVYDLSFDAALKPLAAIPFDEFPTSFLPYLPPPDTPEFPVQALGLHILLDQAPRYALHGMDQRYTFAHFGPLALRLAQELATLPEALQPLRVRRWRELGFDFERAWLRTSCILTAFIHAEERNAHRWGQTLCEKECRSSAEEYYGTVDPTRALDEEDSKDTMLFPSLVPKIAEGADKLTTAEAMWRMCRIDRVHGPIIRVFGRYPYRNGAVGREDADGEQEWVEKTGRFAACAPEIARRIRQDVEAGKWTPLQGGRP